MICTLRYSDGDETEYKTFNNIDSANSFVGDLSEESTDYSADILVNYTAVEFYKEKFEEIYAVMKDNLLSNFVKRPVEKL